MIDPAEQAVNLLNEILGDLAYPDERDNGDYAKLQEAVRLIIRAAVKAVKAEALR